MHKSGQASQPNKQPAVTPVMILSLVLWMWLFSQGIEPDKSFIGCGKLDVLDLVYRIRMHVNKYSHLVWIHTSSHSSLKKSSKSILATTSRSTVTSSNNRTCSVCRNYHLKRIYFTTALQQAVSKKDKTWRWKIRNKTVHNIYCHVKWAASRQA